MLSKRQKRQFVDEGYLVVPGALPKVLIEAARRAVNHSIGHVGISGEALEKHRAGFHCAELLNGIGNGTNGQPKGAYNRNFTAFAEISLAYAGRS